MNGATVMPCDSVVELYIVVLLGTLWFRFCFACGTVFIWLCTVVPFVTLSCVVCPVVPFVTLGLVSMSLMLYVHMEPCENRLIVP